MKPEIADDIELLMQAALCNISPEIEDVEKAAGRVEAFLATYRPKHIDL